MRTGTFTRPNEIAPDQIARGAMPSLSPARPSGKRHVLRRAPCSRSREAYGAAQTTQANPNGVELVGAVPEGPSGIEIFYLMLAATIVGFITVFQTRANAAGLRLHHWSAFVVALAVAGSLVFTLVDGPLLHRLDLPVLEVWGSRALQLACVASFASLMAVLIGRRAILPT
jgi:hypothetical protein